MQSWPKFEFEFNRLERVKPRIKKLIISDIKGLSDFVLRGAALSHSTRTGKPADTANSPRFWVFFFEKMQIRQNEVLSLMELGIKIKDCYWNHQDKKTKEGWEVRTFYKIRKQRKEGHRHEKGRKKSRSVTKNFGNRKDKNKTTKERGESITTELNEL